LRQGALFPLVKREHPNVKEPFPDTFMADPRDLPAAHLASYRLFVEFIAVGDSHEEGSARWPRAWVRAPGGEWKVLDLHRSHRQLELLCILAVAGGPVQADDAEREIAGTAVRTGGIGRNARKGVAKALRNAGVPELMPWNTRPGGAAPGWTLEQAITDVALAVDACDRGDWEAAAALTGDGLGVLTFVAQGEPDVREIGLDDEAALDEWQQARFGVARSVVADARRVGALVREARARESAETDAEIVNEETVRVGRDDTASALIVASPGPGPGTALAIPPRSSQRRRRWWTWAAAAGAAAAVIAAAVVFRVAGEHEAQRPMTTSQIASAQVVRLVIDNRVTDGPRRMREDRKPVRLITYPSVTCEGCAIAGTERHTGEAYSRAACETTGEEAFNSDLFDGGADDVNPGRRRSERYFGVRVQGPNGAWRLGYVNAVWISRKSLEGLQLPQCPAA
jgi:hypothetical protein